MIFRPTPQQHQHCLDYVNHWFWSKDKLSTAAALTASQLDELIEAECIPGIIYSYHDDEGWWSALAAYRGDVGASPKANGRDFYSPAALWWIRRTMLLLRQGYTPADAAKHNETHFSSRYIELAAQQSSLDDPSLHALAGSEWRSWIAGAYAVCLRDFSADICFRKEVLGKDLKQAAKGLKQATPAQQLEIIDKTQELASLLLPFAPWERPTATAGLTIDPILEKLNLGVDIPYPGQKPAQRFD